MNLANVQRVRDAEAAIQAEDRTSCDEFARRLKPRFGVEDIGVSVLRLKDGVVKLRIKVARKKWKSFRATKEVKTVDGVVRAQDLIQYRRNDVIDYLQSLYPAPVSSPRPPLCMFCMSFHSFFPAHSALLDAGGPYRPRRRGRRERRTG